MAGRESGTHKRFIFVKVEAGAGSGEKLVLESSIARKQAIGAIRGCARAATPLAAAAAKAAAAAAASLRTRVAAGAAMRGATGGEAILAVLPLATAGHIGRCGLRIARGGVAAGGARRRAAAGGGAAAALVAARGGASATTGMRRHIEFASVA